MKIQSLVVAGLFIISQVACSKHGDAVAPVVPPVIPQAPDIYITGDSAAPNNKTVAIYWKNGKINALSSGASNANARKGVHSNNSLYIAGDTTAPNGNAIAVYWENGVVHSLTQGNNDAHAIAIAKSGTDMYISGDTGLATGMRLAVYWKNGQLQPLEGVFEQSIAGAIAVSGSDVYVGGTVVLPSNNGNGHTVAVLWKNGHLQQLGDSTLLTNLSAMAISNGIVYAAGSVSGNSTVYHNAATWVNGTSTLLQSNPSFSYSYGLSVAGNDVYVAGASFLSYAAALGVATYWKNGNPVYLTTTPATANAIAADGSDIYVAGNMLSPNGHNIATLWKNGTALSLNADPHDAFAACIIIAPK